VRNSIGELGMGWKDKFSMTRYLISRPDNAKNLAALMICNPNIQAQRNDIYKTFYGHKVTGLAMLVCVCFIMLCPVILEVLVKLIEREETKGIGPTGVEKVVFRYSAVTYPACFRIRKELGSGWNCHSDSIVTLMRPNVP
jgi:hypothetical protein